MYQSSKSMFSGGANPYVPRLFPAFALTAILAACGGGGGGSGGGGGGGVDAPPQLTITSPQDGASITGARVLVVKATATDDKGIATVRAEVNGVAVLPANIVRTGNDISVSVDLKNNANTLSITVADSAGQQASKTLALSYPFLAFDNAQAANLVIGQASLDGGGEADPSKLIGNPNGNPLVHQGRLYLPDSGFVRVMAYNSFPTVNGAAADFVLGQASFTAPNCSPLFSDSCLGDPHSLTANGNQLLVTGYGSNRVLIFNPAPTTSGAAAQVVVGQVDLTSIDAACSATGLNTPESSFVVDGKLIVADGGNHRVLIWNTVPTANNTPADLVLGQGGFTSCAANDDDQNASSDAASSARTLRAPSDVWSDGKRLFVADTENHRVLIWDTFPTSNFTPATTVLGQADFASSSSGTAAGRLFNPYFLTSNGNQLFVADLDNHRVMVWNTIPATNGALADRVIGQANFTAGTMNAGQPGVNAQGLNFPAGLALHNNRLIVADSENSRYVSYQALPD